MYVMTVFNLPGNLNHLDGSWVLLVRSLPPLKCATFLSSKDASSLQPAAASSLIIIYKFEINIDKPCSSVMYLLLLTPHKNMQFGSVN